MTELLPPTPPRTARVVRPRASAFHRARRLAWMRHRGIRLAALGVLTAGLASATVGGVLAAGYGTLPNADALITRPLPSDTLVYDRTGQVLLADLHPAGYQHDQVQLSAMGTYLPEATVAVEDANFWSEPGVDPFGIARAAVSDLRAHAAVQGGSTITQQLVKLRLVGDDASVARKIREAALAMRISATYSKSQVLELYLNAISYGNSAYGAGAAAQVYFHRDPARLDLAQAALLAGLPQNPTLLNPLEHWDAAKQRQRQVLDAMVRARDISAEQADAAFAEDLSPPAHIFGPTALDLAPGFVGYLQGEIADRFGKDAVQSGGLRIVSTLDWGLEQLAQQSITGTVQSNAWRSVTDGALVSIDPRTGQVLAMVGSAGPNVPGGQFDMAIWPPRSPGSSFKIFTYTAAIASRRYTMVTPIVDAPLLVQPPGGQRYTPQNYDQRYHGVCEVQQCLGNSLNIPAVQVELGTGISNIVDVARSLGAPPYQQHGGRYTSDDPASSFQPSLTLGGYGETPLQMAAGASVLAAGGVQHQPEAILAASAADGHRVYTAGAGGRRVLDEGTAFIMSQMLSNDANRAMIFGTGTPLTLPGRHVAAKTGTAENFADGWTVGYTPSLATAVWMGNTDFHPMRQGTDGVYVAAPAWHEFMAGALDRLGKGDEWYAVPAGLDVSWVRGQQAFFLPGTSAATPAPPLPSWAQLAGGRDRGRDCLAWIFQGGPLAACIPGGDQGGGGHSGHSGN